MIEEHLPAFGSIAKVCPKCGQAPSKEFEGRAIRQAKRLAAKFCQDAVIVETQRVSGRIESHYIKRGATTPKFRVRSSQRPCQVRAANKKELRHWFGIFSPPTPTTRRGRP
ncbi:MAG: hypothetical protein Q8Q85_00560 [Gemmatimonadales bacterium]|nr:hypothetical protein [Gemmatimonadales bacterium]